MSMTENITLIRIFFMISLIAGIILRIISIGIFLNVRNRQIKMNPSEVLRFIDKDNKSVFKIDIIYKRRPTPFYAYSENLNIQTNELTLNCEEDTTSLYSACAVIQKYFAYKSASVKRAHYNFSKIMSFCIGLFSVVSIFLVSLGNNVSDESMMISGMMVYAVTFLCSVITTDFDLFASLDSIRYINENKGIFSVNHYYAKRVFLGYIFHKLSRAAAVLFLPASVIMGFLL